MHQPALANVCSLLVFRADGERCVRQTVIARRRLIRSKLILELFLALATAAGAYARAPVSQLPASAKRWAVVVGVDKYDRREEIHTLEGAAADARALRDVLVTTAGFPSDQVVVLATGEGGDHQPTRLNILRALSNVLGLVPQDGLFLFAFSGHGITRGEEAFLLPADAQAINDVAFLEDTAISASRIRDRIQDRGVAQVIVLLDACRSDPGKGDTANRLSSAYVKSLTFDVRNHDVRAFATIYATALGERAYEYVDKGMGYFTWAIVEALRGAAANENGEITLSALLSHVQTVVPKQVAIDLGADALQKPYARFEGFRAQDLVLAVVAPKRIDAPAEAQVPAARVSPPERETGNNAELRFWQSVERTNTPAAYDEYLRKYGDGTYAGLARINRNLLAGKRADFRAVAERSYLAGRFAEARRILERGATIGDLDSEIRLASLEMLCIGGHCDSDSAMRHLERATSLGSLEAEGWLALMWLTRGGDIGRALEYARASGEKGELPGLLALGVAYESGIGVDPDARQADDVYARALPALRERTTAGDPWAANFLGTLYNRGRGGLSQDGDKATALFRTAAAAGYPSAATNLATMYEYGEKGVALDVAKAVELNRAAAELGHVIGQTQLADIYLKRGGDDMAEGVALLIKAADQGYPPAMNSLGLLYQFGGAGLPKDDVRARDLFERASDHEPDAQNNLAVFYQAGRGGLRPDDKKAVQWFTKAARRGNAYAQLNLASMYETGRGGLPMSDESAATWYRSAAEQGLARAQITLARFYETGRGVPRDYGKALDFYTRAADQDVAVAQTSLASMYEQGRGVPQDLAKAVELYRRAADHGDDVAENNLAGIYLKGGVGVPQDFKGAIVLYRKAAEHGNPNAAYSLGSFSESGSYGATKDLSLSVRYYQQAADRGHAAAQACLAWMYERGLGGLVKSDTQAAGLYLQAAAQGDSMAQNNLAIFYEVGRGGLEKNIAKAIDLFRQAAAQGLTAAKQNLQRLKQ